MAGKTAPQPGGAVFIMKPFCLRTQQQAGKPAPGGRRAGRNEASDRLI